MTAKIVNTIRVANLVQKALMELVLKEFEPGGKWSGKSQANLAKPWIGVKVIVDPTNLGRNFETQKTNWNVNDSNWVNPNWTAFAEAARKANKGKEMAKKAVVFELVELKRIFGLRAKEVKAEVKTEEKEAA